MSKGHLTHRASGPTDRMALEDEATSDSKGTRKGAEGPSGKPRFKGLETDLGRISQYELPCHVGHAEPRPPSCDMQSRQTSECRNASASGHSCYKQVCISYTDFTRQARQVASDDSRAAAAGSWASAGVSWRGRWQVVLGLDWGSAQHPSACTRVPQGSEHGAPHLVLQLDVHHALWNEPASIGTSGSTAEKLPAS